MAERKKSNIQHCAEKYVLLSPILIIIISFICLRVFENDGSRQEDKRSLYSRSQISSYRHRTRMRTRANQQEWRFVRELFV